jgi:hypothetical protein
VVHPAGVANAIPCRVEVKVPDSGGTPAAELGTTLGSTDGVGDGDGAALGTGAPTGADDEPGLRNQTPKAPTATTTTAAAASLA